MFRSILGSLPLLTIVLPPAVARTGCDDYGRCFEFSGTDDALTSESGRSLRERFGSVHVPPVDQGDREED